MNGCSEVLDGLCIILEDYAAVGSGDTNKVLADQALTGLGLSVRCTR